MQKLKEFTNVNSRHRHHGGGGGGRGELGKKLGETIFFPQRSSNPPPPYPHVLLPHLRLRVKWYTPVATEKDAFNIPFLPITNFFV